MEDKLVLHLGSQSSPHLTASLQSMHSNTVHGACEHTKERLTPERNQTAMRINDKP